MLCCASNIGIGWDAAKFPLSLDSEHYELSLLLTSTPLSRCKYAPGEGHLSSRGLIYPLSLPFGERS